MSILNRTNIASITFTDDNGVHIRVYYQDNEGNICETFYDQGNGWALRELDIIGIGRLNTGIAATTWNHGTQIRVYFFDRENRLVERCYEGGGAGEWSDGYLTNQHFVGSAVSSVATTGGFSDGPRLCVYYQGADGFIYEMTNMKSSHGRQWATKKITLPAVPLRSSLAATYLSDGRKRRVYTMNNQNQLIEMCTDDGESWSPGATLLTPGGENRQIGAGIACAAGGKGGSERISVFSVLADNTVVCNRTSKTEWQPPFIIAGCITFSAVAGFLKLTDTRLNVYFQVVGKHITEYTSDEDGGGFTPNMTDLPRRQ